jgi:hypothetical protein
MTLKLAHALAIAAMLMALPLAAQNKDKDDDEKPAGRSQAGLLTGVKKLPPITLSSGKPLAAKAYELEAGKYYRLPITSDGTAELGIAGSDFFRNVWINEIVINGIEIRPLGVESLEFDDEGTATVSFVTIRPGTFTLRVPNTTSDAQAAVFKVK